jgi:hypothetical protein
VTVEQEDPKGDLVLRLRPEHASDIESVLRASLFDDEIAEPSAEAPRTDSTPGAESEPQDEEEVALDPESALEDPPEALPGDSR